ncbi:DUF1120 domain-containing protein [Herbaspirillum robiniae]|uniref:DUF1120 domain-containing protein n=1 Tax=Herbaspirillum robiniae TaxID=2014887 RepID=UPI003D776D86
MSPTTHALTMIGAARLGLLCACALALPAQAGPTAELRVTGRIVPDACVPSFVGGGVVDYGVIPAAATSSAATLLSRKSVGLNVSCAMPTSVGIRLLDNRPAPPASGMIKTSGRPSMLRDERYFGLKNDKGDDIGGYVLRFEAGDKTAAPALQLNAGSALGTWESRGDAMLLKNTLYTWSGDGRVPGKLQHMGATLSVQPVIDGRAAQAGEETLLDGSATLELVYL